MVSAMPSKEHEGVLETAVETLKSEGYEVVTLKGKIPDAIAYKGETLFVEADVQGLIEKKAAAFRKYYPNVNVRFFSGKRKAEAKPLNKRGYKQIVVPLRLYEKLKKLKGDKSFNQLLSKLIDTYKMSMKIKEAKSVDIAKVSTPTVQRVEVEVKPSMEYRSHLCRDCSFDAKGVEHCRIRQYQYAIYGLECPRQKALKGQPAK
jgi:predicted CopG family antitoxin